MRRVRLRILIMMAFWIFPRSVICFCGRIMWRSCCGMWGNTGWTMLPTMGSMAFDVDDNGWLDVIFGAFMDSFMRIGLVGKCPMVAVDLNGDGRNDVILGGEERAQLWIVLDGTTDAR
ncbi:MAG: hypothetical protein M2R45_05260 [Verrucomicrobia subdivision 3 bacterium]|nr:hypothetical protein [Limisphaerales bacterium]